MSFLIACTARNCRQVFAYRTIAVEVDQTVGGHELILGGCSLTFTGTNEGFYPSVLMTPYGGCRPVIAVLAIAQALAVTTDLTELTTGATVEAPPYTDGHTIFQADHCFDDIMHLVCIPHFAVFLHLLEEISKRVERAGQLMGVAPFIICLAGGIPVKSFVIVQRISTDYYDISKTRIPFF